ncbi:MAG TPA: hypothetical protein VF785_11620 [Gemmatimonadaceae bacterium]
METREKETVRIELTPNQKETVKAAVGRDAEAIELTIKELEARITPALAANHNETLLVA